MSKTLRPVGNKDKGAGLLKDLALNKKNVMSSGILDKSLLNGGAKQKSGAMSKIRAEFLNAIDTTTPDIHEKDDGLGL